MLKSYEAIYDQGRLTWLDKAPQLADGARVIVVCEAEQPSSISAVRRQPPERLRGRGVEHGGVMEPAIPAEDWGDAFQ